MKQSNGIMRLIQRGRSRQDACTAVERQRGTIYTVHCGDGTRLCFFVSRGPTGWSCSCEDYIDTGTCKHIGAVDSRARSEGWEFGAIASPNAPAPTVDRRTDPSRRLTRKETKPCLIFDLSQTG